MIVIVIVNVVATLAAQSRGKEDTGSICLQFGNVVESVKLKWLLMLIFFQCSYIIATWQLSDLQFRLNFRRC
jgi:hypothetical protein